MYCSVSDQWKLIIYVSMHFLVGIHFKHLKTLFHMLLACPVHRSVNGDIWCSLSYGKLLHYITLSLSCHLFAKKCIFMITLIVLFVF